MSATCIQFSKPPQIGFAHHFYQELPYQYQNDIQQCFVLIYVKSGHLTAHIYGQLYEADAGSLLILFRHTPFRLVSADNNPQDYCSIQVYTDYSFFLLDDGEAFPENFTGLALPVVIPPCPETESIKKDMYTIVSNLAVSRSEYSFSAAMSVCGILSELDAIYRQRIHRGQPASTYWEHRIKRYIAEHIQQRITLDEIAFMCKKTPNYLNSVFKQATGSNIHQYINREKMRLIAALMETNRIPFPVACENVGITDISHGYRLFKKHMGVTPSEYMQSEHSRNQ